MRVRLGGTIVLKSGETDKDVILESKIKPSSTIVNPTTSVADMVDGLRASEVVISRKSTTSEISAANCSY
ncbi:hypothetical protein V6N13_115903 [Hibiscus sabdariffa]